MEFNQKLNILKRFEFLNYLGPSEQKNFARDCEEINLKAGEILFREKDSGDSMYVILLGEVWIYKENTMVAKRGCGDIIGELSLIGSHPRSATVECVVDSSFLKITRAQFEFYFTSNSKILVSLLKVIARRFIADINALDSVYQNIKIHAKNMEESNKELQSFAYIASHDLQEPLRKIIAFGDRLSSHAVHMDDDGKMYLDRIVTSSLRMKELINDILQYSNVMAGDNLFEEVDLNKVIGNVLLDLEGQIAQTQGEIKFNDMPSLEAIPCQMQQLFQNLISNSLKYHRRGISPVINITSTSTDNNHCKITIEDNGMGIEEKHYDRVFKIFERLHGKSSYEGTGIGLALCKKIIGRHGGEINLESQPQQGTKFKIILPVKQTP